MGLDSEILIASKRGVIIKKGEVRLSFRKTEKPHMPWIALNNSGAVLTEYCNYMVRCKSQLINQTVMSFLISY